MICFIYMRKRAQVVGLSSFAVLDGWSLFPAVALVVCRWFDGPKVFRVKFSQHHQITAAKTAFARRQIMLS